MAQPQEEVIDLSDQVDYSAPQEKRYGAIIWSSLLMILGWAFLSILCSLTALATGVDGESSFVIFMIACFSVPVGVIGLIFLFLTGKRLKKPLPPVRKAWKVLYSMLSIATSALCFGVALAPTMSSLGEMASFIGIPITIVLMIVFFVTTFSLSIEHGKEGLRMLCACYFISLLIACITGWLVAKALVAIALGLVVMVVGSVLFFAGGGRVVRVYREY